MSEHAESSAESVTPDPVPEPDPAPAVQASDTAAELALPPSTASSDDLVEAEAEVDVTTSGDAEQLATLALIEKRLDELVRLGDRNADHVGSLHSENQRLRNGELQAVLNTYIRDVIRVYDDVVRLTGASSSAEGDLRIVGDLLVGALGRWGVDRFQPALGDPFDTSVHSGVGRISTSEHTSNTIANVRRCGFRTSEGKVIRTADVEVFWQEEPAAVLSDYPSAGSISGSIQELEP